MVAPAPKRPCLKLARPCCTTESLLPCVRTCKRCSKAFASSRGALLAIGLECANTSAALKSVAQTGSQPALRKRSFETTVFSWCEGACVFGCRRCTCQYSVHIYTFHTSSYSFAKAHTRGVRRGRRMQKDKSLVIISALLPPSRVSASISASTPGRQAPVLSAAQGRALQ